MVSWHWDGVLFAEINHITAESAEQDRLHVCAVYLALHSPQKKHVKG